MANNIKYILDILNITQNELAKRLNIDRQRLYQTISAEKPRKFNKLIAQVLNIDEAFLTKQVLTNVDKLLIQKQHLMSEVAELPVDEIMAYSGEAQLIDNEIKLERLFEKIRSQVNIEGGDDTIFNMYQTIVMYFENESSMESKIIKASTDAMKADNYLGYIRGVITKEQRKLLLENIVIKITEFDEANRASI